MSTLTSGRKILAEYALDRGSVDRVTTHCIVRTVTEHLLTLDLQEGVPGPATGAIADLTVDGRRYRSTVQRSEHASFTLLRPRELPELHELQRQGAASTETMWPE